MKFVYDCELTLNISGKDKLEYFNTYFLGLNNLKDNRGELKLKEVNNHDLDDNFEVLIYFNLVWLFG